MAHRSHTSPKADDYRLLQLALSPNPPTPEDSNATASPVQDVPSPATPPSPPKGKASPKKGKGSPLKLKFSPSGKVKDMISKIERSRSHTLPTSPRSPRTKSSKSEGGTPLLGGSPKKRLGLLKTYAVPVKGGEDESNHTDGKGDDNNFVGSQSLPDLDPSFFDAAMKQNHHNTEEDHATTSATTTTTTSNLVTQNSSSHPLLSNNASTHQPIQLESPAPSPAHLNPHPPPQTGFSVETPDEAKRDLIPLSDVNALDPFTAPSSVRSVEGYMSMTKPTITDSGGYVKMQPSLMTSYSQPKSPTSVATSPVYAVGESSDIEQSVKDHKLLSPEPRCSPRPSPEPTSDTSVGRGSMENLFEGEEFDVDEDKHKGRKKIKKRFRKFFKRHKSVEMPSKSSKRGSGVSSPTSSISSFTRKSRSISNVEQLKVTIDEDNFERDLSPPTPSKPRSVSENDILDDDAPGYPVKRSYTMLTDHITKKYQKKILEKLRTDSGVSSGSGMSETPSTLSPVKESLQEDDDKGAAQIMMNGGQEMVDLTPPSKMSPPRYRRSLYCDQLMYKLRAALQNIHTPLSLSPIYHQLCVDDDAKCDSRYQLILLIQHAHQRSRWRHDVMEIALLTELLKMIEPLPNEL